MRMKGNELTLVKKELLSTINDKKKLKSALENLKNFFNVVVKTN